MTGPKAAASPEPVANESAAQASEAIPTGPSTTGVLDAMPVAVDPAPVWWHHPRLGFMSHVMVTQNERNLGPSWIPLYAHPSAAAERIALLEGLLLRANRCVRMDGDDDLADEIEAALKGNDMAISPCTRGCQFENLTAELNNVRVQCDSYMLLSKMRPAPMADMVPAEELAKAQAENFSLAAGQCIVDGGLCGDDYGNQYCKVKAERDAAVAALDTIQDWANTVATAHGVIGITTVRAAIDAARKEGQ
jgi:hypothetical protein